MAKVVKATKGDSKGEPIIENEQTQSGEGILHRHMSQKLPKLKPEVAEAVTVEVLRGLYVEHVKFYVKNKDVSTADNLLTKEEAKQHEEILKSLEGAIAYLDQTDQWLKDLHAGKFSEPTND
jgi:hypothetical protein